MAPKKKNTGGRHATLRGPSLSHFEAPKSSTFVVLMAL